MNGLRNMARDFIFDAILSYDKRKYKKKEINAVLSFIRELTLEVNESDYTRTKYKGFSNN